MNTIRAIKPTLFFLEMEMMQLSLLEVIQVNAAAAPLDGGASNLSYNRRLLQNPVNRWTRGCSKITKCGGGIGK
ncbi:hypothetical protein F3Y22_tig00006992pilonHSYRG00043 [Hibiscus syriacus]|uniref:Uncharacterized protein n=1 Tax=Hibiscus syriacus TaxID=106335 RepID=A0A6A3CGC7_HIBSY|nr:hypothetical protein F3Y22_tig00006992pilonHSYRG00043 [Hibiscus syriacus]